MAQYITPEGRNFIETPLPKNPGQDFLLQSLLTAGRGLIDRTNTKAAQDNAAGHTSQLQDEQTDNTQSNMKLADLLKTGQNQQDLANQNTNRQNMLKQLPAVQATSPNSSAALSDSGVSTGAPSNAEDKSDAADAKADDSARKHASDQYSKETSKMGERLNFANQAMTALKNNDPNASGLVIQSLMGSKDFKRFNDKESAKVAPTSLKEQLATKMQQVGLDPNSFFADGALNDSQKAMHSRAMLSNLDDVTNSINTAKQRALNSYKTMGSSSDEGEEALGKLGGEYSDQLQELRSGFSKMVPPPPTAGAPAAAASPSGGFHPLDNLKNFFTQKAAPPSAGGDTTNAPTPPAPRKPQTVIQRGHTYTLNPQTGQYE